MIDHESLLLDHFTCPRCGKPLQLIELRRTPEELRREPEHIDLVAACRTCEIGYRQDEWRKRAGGAP